MIRKEIENIEEADLQHLIDEQIIEKKTLDYKSNKMIKNDSSYSR